MPEYFPIQLLGTSFGLIAAVFSVASAISPIVGGMIADLTGSMSGVVVISIVCFLLGGICMMILRRLNIKQN
jgi:MFS family permease